MFNTKHCNGNCGRELVRGNAGKPEDPCPMSLKSVFREYFGFPVNYSNTMDFIIINNNN